MHSLCFTCLKRNWLYYYYYQCWCLILWLVYCTMCCIENANEIQIYNIWLKREIGWYQRWLDLKTGRVMLKKMNYSRVQDSRGSFSAALILCSWISFDRRYSVLLYLVFVPQTCTEVVCVAFQLFCFRVAAILLYTVVVMFCFCKLRSSVVAMQHWQRNMDFFLRPFAVDEIFVKR
jgi:hypothetical protein